MKYEKDQDMMNNNILPFLIEVAANNNREWFKANKKFYEQSRREFEHLIETVIAGIGNFDSQVRGLTAKSAIFRIYRDVRFSKDKRPYKTHFGAYMAEGGRKSSKAAYYLHIEPGGCFLGGGLYHPDNQQLKKVRQQLDYDPEGLRKIISSPAFTQVYGTMQGTKLKTAPRDYPKDHPDIDLLRYKDFLATHRFDDEIIAQNDVHYIIEKLKALKPFNDYLNDALLFEGEEPVNNFGAI